MTGFAYDVFLSHNSGDKPRVRRLAQRLADAGLTVWLDDWIIRPGDDIYLAVEHGLHASRTLILCLSPAALASNWVALERSTVLFRDPSNAGRRFIPLLLADCELPDTLRRYKYVDYRKESAKAFRELLAACGITDPRAARRKVAKPRAVVAEPPRERGGAKPEPEGSVTHVWTARIHGVDWVNDIHVSADGTWAISAADDGTAQAWNLDTGTTTRTLSHDEAVNAVALTPDNRRALSASNDENLHLWDLETGARLTWWPADNDVMSLAITPDGKYALAGVYETGVDLWDLQTETRIAQLTTSHDDDDPWDIAITPDGQLAVVAGDRALDVWDVRTGALVGTLKGHTHQLYAVRVSPNGELFASCGQDQTIRLWSRAAMQCVATLEGHSGQVFAIAFSPDGSLLASVSPADATLRFWDCRSGALLDTVKHSAAAPTAVTFTPDGRHLLVGLNNGQITKYRLASVKPKAATPPTRRYVNAKVVLLGESGVGKSGLAYRLAEDKFVETRSTHGMQVWKLDLPLPPNESLEREALLWDLAGQEDYRLIHQLFLDETALALVVVNPQKDDPFSEVPDWLKALGSAVARKDAGRDVVRLLIAGRIDVGSIRVSERKIDGFLKDYGFAAYLPTSAFRGDNCSDSLNGGRPSALKELIASHIRWDELPWTATPQLLADIKSSIVEMRDKREIRLLRFAELSQRLEQSLTAYTFAESDVRTGVRLLANHGLVVPFKFGDLVLMQPELLNGYASAVVRAARAHVDEIGSVREADVYSPDFDFQGVDRLRRPDEELLLRAMVQTLLEKALCIAEDTPDGRQLIFPSQFRRERPIPAHPDVFVSYTFSGEWQTIYTTLVVRLWYSREFEQKELWQNAVEFTTAKGRTAGLIMRRSGEGRATISIFFEADVPDELKWAFIKYVNDHLARYARNVERDRRYVCGSCSKPVTDHEAVRERLEANKTFIYCQKCDEKVPLIDWIEQRLASNPVARRVLGMEQTERRERDTQALEQILTGHMMAICGEANQIFRELTKFDYGIDGEIEFKGNDGKPSGRKIYVQLKSGGSYLRRRKKDGVDIFDVKDERHLRYWVEQPVDVYLVIRDEEEKIRWMNITRHLRQRKDKRSRQIAFQGEPLDAAAIWRVRDEFITAAAVAG